MTVQSSECSNNILYFRIRIIEQAKSEGCDLDSEIYSEIKDMAVILGGLRACSQEIFIF